MNKESKEILAGTCGDVGFIIGGDTCRVFGSKDDYTDEDIKKASEKWWEYGKDYWKWTKGSGFVVRFPNLSRKKTAVVHFPK